MSCKGWVPAGSGAGVGRLGGWCRGAAAGRRETHTPPLPHPDPPAAAAPPAALAPPAPPCATMSKNLPVGYAHQITSICLLEIVLSRCGTPLDPEDGHCAPMCNLAKQVALTAAARPMDPEGFVADHSWFHSPPNVSGVHYIYSTKPSDHLKSIGRKIPWLAIYARPISQAFLPWYFSMCNTSASWSWPLASESDVTCTRSPS